MSNGVAVQAYWLHVGSSVGARDLYGSGPTDPSTLSRTVTGLPGTGQTVHVRLCYQVGTDFLLHYKRACGYRWRR